MDMTPQTAWLIAILAAVLVGVAAFFIGRSSASGSRTRVEELEAALRTKEQEMEAALRDQRQELETYRKDVEAHFDRTATLFVSMAGSYKGLFEHLSDGYEKLSTGSARELFQQRVDALLIGNAKSAEADRETGPLLGTAAATAAAATLAAGESSEAGADAVATSAELAAAPEASVETSPETSPETGAETSPEPGVETSAAGSDVQPEAPAGEALPEAATNAQDEAGVPPATAAVPQPSAGADEIVRRAEGESFDFEHEDQPARDVRPGDS